MITVVTYVLCAILKIIQYYNEAFQIFYPRLKSFLFGKSNGKSLSNCKQ